MSSRSGLFGPPPPGGNGDALSAVLENAYNARQAALGGGVGVGGNSSREARWEAARLARESPSLSLQSAAPIAAFSPAPNSQLLLPNVERGGGPTLADELRSGVWRWWWQRYWLGKGVRTWLLRCEMSRLLRRRSIG